jgi:hypothetical protein
MRSDEEPFETTVDDGSFAKTALSRRDFLRFAGLAGVSIGVGAGFAGLLAACSGGEETTTTAAAVRATTATAASPATTVRAGPQPPAQDTIVIGAARSVTGPLASFEAFLFGPA